MYIYIYARSEPHALRYALVDAAVVHHCGHARVLLALVQGSLTQVPHPHPPPSPSPNPQSYMDELLSHRCTLSCDGQPVTIPPSIEGLMVLNTPSYGGGSDLWDEARGAPLQATTRHFQSSPARPLDMSDGLVEVVGVTDVLHLACSLGGLSNGVRLCQGERISIGVPGGGVPLQIDGEPYNQAEGPRHAEGFDVTIARSGQALLLSAPAQHSVPGANPVQVRARFRGRGSTACPGRTRCR